ncbi:MULTISPECIES: AsmA-like C-terminal region-containing protein [Dethiosulfovibrio]|uniref:AsmA-like C-terminal domain-containing protein n=2 Tax=Dethiosulfovibrio TaxID=47054 RepID=A0ABS9EPV9_9BACT|nr:MULTISPECIES: AsmA-like C-terminal region-containing protein [Dethiosulfovibrio]MCF4114836.1 hypothetical protein [Dethiosulfovibrio russensis]MCF4143233.1 hypothetical protein [Dethiosulfovibrio marinus]MCF4145341.1 hypothetical protein [Dethiosulfovibrio acidaminovorans]
MSKKTAVGLSLAVLVVAAGFLLAVTDLGTGVVKSQATKILSQTLEAKVSMGEVSGNPVKGYDIRNLDIVKDGEYSLKVPSIEIKTNLMGILGKGALVRRLSLVGLDTDPDQIQALIDGLPRSEGSEPSSIPVEIVELKDSSLTLPGGDLEISLLSAALNQGEFLNVGLKLDLSYLGLPVKGDISALYGGSMATIESSKLSVGSGSVSVKGDLLPDLAADGTVDGLKLEELAKLWPPLAEGAMEGSASLAVKAGGSLTAPVLSGTMGFDGKLASVPVKDLKGNWSYQDMSIEVSSLKAAVAGVPLSGGFSALFGPGKPKVTLKLDASDADLGKLRGTYSQIPKEVSGVIDSIAVDLSGPVDGLKGTIKARAESLSLWGQSLSQSWISVVMDSKGVAKLSSKTVLQGQPAYLEGTVSFLGDSPQADLLLKARKVSTKLVAALSGADIPMEGDLDLDVTVKGPLSGPSIKGKVSSPSLSGFGQTIGKPSVSFALKGSDLEIPSAKAEWFGAPITASGLVSTGGKSPKLSMKGKLGGLDLAKVAAGFDLPSGLLSGLIDGSLNLDGPLDGLGVDLALSSGKLSLAGVSVEKVDLGLTGDSSALKVSRGSAMVSGGSVEASGSISLVDGPVLDLALEGSKIMLEKAVDLPLKAAVSGTVRAKGPAASPEVSMALSSPKVVAWGVGVDGVSASLVYKDGVVDLKEAVASVGGSPLSLKGNMNASGSVPKGSFELSGPDLDLSKATKDIVDADAYGIGGKLSVVFKGTFEGEKGSGSGYVKSPSLTVMNMAIKNLNCPLKLAGTKLDISEATADLYGGKVSSSGLIDLGTMKFSKKVSLSGTDVAPLIKDFAGTKGTVTGTAKANFSASGVLSPFAMKGEGTLDLGGGRLIGFPIADVAASLHGSDGISYAKGHGDFRVVDTVLHLDKGTLVTAREGDRIYRTMAVVGTVGPDKKLNLSCSGEVNVKLLNAAVGAGIGGLAGGGVGTLAAVVGGVLGGAQQGIAKDDFRDVSFRVAGTMDSSSIKDLKVGPSKIAPEKTEAAPAEKVLPSVPKDVVSGVSEDVQEPSQPKKLEDQLKEAVEEEAGKLLQGILGGGKD